MRFTRRAVLAALGTPAISAGCLSSAPSDESTETSEPSPATTSPPDASRHVRMGQTVTSAATHMTVANPRVRKAVVSPGMAHTRVVADGGQFVVVDVTINGEAPDRPVDLDLWAAIDETSLSGGDPFPTAEAPEQYAFAFPATQHDTAAIKWATEQSDVYWDVPTPIVETLTQEPKFDVTEFQTLRRNGHRVLDLSVANNGERDGQFRARVSFEGFSGGSILEFPVPAGEIRSYTGRPGKILLYFENHGGNTLTLQYPADDGLTTVERTVRRTTTTGASS